MATMEKRKLSDRLVEFFLTRQWLRWRIYLFSIGIAFLWALLRLTVSNQSEEEATLEALIVLCSLLVALTTFYFAIGRDPLAAIFPKRQSSSGGIRINARLAFAGAAGIVFLFVAARINIPKMQAAVADFRLKSFATRLDTVQAKDLTDQQVQARFRKIESIVNVSSDSKIPVDPEILKQTQVALSGYLKRKPLPDPIRQAGWTTALDLRSLAYSRDVQTGALATREISNSGFPIRSNLVLKTNVSFRGNHSPFEMSASIVIDNYSVVFEGIDFRSTSVDPIYLRGENANVLIRDSIFQAPEQHLDRITWVNVRFEKTRILYNHGPLRLRNVSFSHDCDLRVIEFDSNAISIELTRRIHEAKEQPITFVYEPS
jgi:hypothetical protein